MVALSRYYPSEELLNAPKAMLPSEPRASSRRSCGMSSHIEGNEFSKKVETFLRSRHPHKTALNVALDSGNRVSEHQVRKWLSGSAVPSGVALLVLISAYGPEFLAAVFPSAPDWLDAACRTAQIARLKQGIAELQAKRAAAL